MATITERLNSNTAGINEASELLKVLGDRIGKYVWKKCEKSVGEVTIKMTASKSGSNHVLTLTCDKIDLSKIDSSFFVGKEFVSTNGAYLMKFTSETQFVTGSGSAFTYTYDPSTKQITAPVSSWSVTTWKDYVYTEKPVFLGEYVVANTEDAYPNSGEQDGYWYEAVEGVSGIDYGEVTVTSASTSLTVKHNLKAIPTKVLLLKADNKSSSTGSASGGVVYPVQMINGNRTAFVLKCSGSPYYSVEGSSLANTYYPTLTKDDITFNNGTGNSYPFIGTYFWAAVE